MYFKNNYFINIKEDLMLEFNEINNDENEFEDFNEDNEDSFLKIRYPKELY
jgi:hypothetical protein